MIRHQSFSTVPTADKGASVAIGNFDGVHLGHQAVIDLARDQAETLLAPLGIITFEPHPRTFFAPDAPPFRLMSANAKAARLEKLGVEKLYEVPFNPDLSNLTAQEFVDQVLVWGLGVSHVVVGADFRFGKGRTGTAEMLKEAGASKGFGVTIVPLVSDGSGQFSSTAIRDALSAGRPEEAARMLGHWHRIEGRSTRSRSRLSHCQHRDGWFASTQIRGLCGRGGYHVRSASGALSWSGLYGGAANFRDQSSQSGELPF